MDVFLGEGTYGPFIQFFMKDTQEDCSASLITHSLEDIEMLTWWIDEFKKRVANYNLTKQS